MSKTNNKLDKREWIWNGKLLFMPRKLFRGKSNRIKLEGGVVEPLPQLKEFIDCVRFTLKRKLE